jgi:histidinol-phosphate aminotransferase
VRIAGVENVPREGPVLFTANHAGLTETLVCFSAIPRSDLKALGLRVTPSVANFVLFHFPAGKPVNADRADTFLKSRGVIVRKVGAYGFPNALRMTIGSGEDNKRAIAALKDYMSGAAA